jgi:hypothetical protein
MQRDFHYYCIAVLAKAAGFSSPEALIIAYASQYVDDATENKPLTLVDEYRGYEFKFDPVRTQYTKGLKVNDWTVHKTIYLPFHFLPPIPIRYPHLGQYVDWVQGPFDYVTQPDSPFARMLLEEAGKEEDKVRRLCRIGIALHTYADTWSHRRFSGREAREENLVEDPDYFDGQDWKRDTLLDGTIERFVSALADNTGHAEAGFLPDISFLRWRYRNAQNQEITRRNEEEFLEAAKRIYEELCAINTAPKDPVIPWEEIKNGIAVSLAERGGIEGTISAWDLYAKVKDSLAERCRTWQQSFRHLFDQPARYEYDKQEWRRIALAPNVRPDPYFYAVFAESQDPGDETDDARKAPSGWEQQSAWEEWSQGLDYAPLQQAEESRQESWSEWDVQYRYDSELDYDERDLDWDNWSHDERRFGRLKFPLKPNFPDSLWVHFHRAALLQRHIVVEMLP